MVIEGVTPQVDGGRFPIKRVIGEEVVVEADLFIDGHEPAAGVLLYRHEEERKWSEAPLAPLENDRWRGSFTVSRLGRYRYTIEGWLARHADRKWAGRCERELEVVVDPPLARFGAWYELFPRSWGSRPGKHGTFQELERHLPTIAAMGFDVLYLPPIHPVGRTERKGKNNSLECGPDDPGSPWGIGSKEGGHKAVHPQLGTVADFRRLVARAEDSGLQVALDIALHCCPDHPYVKEHPEWFRRRPDGTVQFAENPPKKYQDIYPFDFESPRWRALWEEMKSIFEFWIRQGVKIFRVDNPHTKPFPFWEWLIGELKREHPDLILLSEAFTRPKVMYHLARIGFTQSYTYFTWRNGRQELADYFTELSRPPVREFFRPALWPNTPDILHAYLQNGGPPAFRVRFILAATLGATYGIYGPAFELCENQPKEPGSEEYLNSEKYEIKQWDFERARPMRELITRVNRIRRENPALQGKGTLAFHPTDNDQILCYSQVSSRPENRILAVVNLDPSQRQTGHVNLDAGSLRLDLNRPFQLQDLLDGSAYTWTGPRNYVELDPGRAHLFQLRAEGAA